MPVVIHYAGAVKPQRLLDIGVGMGTYGFLVRQFLDVSQERIEKKDWKLKIDGVEIYDGYRNPTWDYAYDSVQLCDIKDIINDLPRYDVILCNDVLEHFERETALILISQLLDRCDTLIATTPNRDFIQGAWGGNEAETHHCLLQPEDFPKLIAWCRTGVTNCYVCCSDLESSKAIVNAHFSCPIVTQPEIPVFKRAFNKISRLFKGSY
jgi:hypothetical protein